MPIIKFESDLADTGTSIAFFEYKQMYRYGMKNYNHINFKRIIKPVSAEK